MSTIVTRAGKGSALTFNEVDSNFTNLNTDKYQSGGALGTPASGTLTNCTGYTYANLSGTVPTWNQNTTGNAGTVTNGVYTTGDQTINGTKTFSSTIVGSVNGNAATVTDGVYTSDIGTTVQAHSANLDEFATVNPTAAGLALLDDADAAAQRTTLGLGTAATTASTDYATAAQGTKADSALQSSDIGSTVQAYDSNLTSFVNTFTLPTTDGTSGQSLVTNGSGTLSFSSAGAGTVTSIDMTVPTGLAVSGNPITSSGTLAVSYASGYAIPTTAKQTEWDSAYTQSLQWDGGATNLVATTGRASLLPSYTGNANKVLAVNTGATDVEWVSAGGSGTVTSVSGTGTVNGITLTGTVTSSGDLTLGGTLSGIGNSQLTNSSVTFNGQTVALGASGTITANTTNALTIGTGLSGTSFDGSSAVTIANSGVLSNVAGTGISVSGATGNVTITNSAPDQTVVLTAGTGINTSGTYPNFTITNSSPDQTVALTGAGTTSISGSYPNFTITSNDQYSGTVTSITAGTGLTGGTITGSGTIAIDSTVTTLSGTQTLTNKRITSRVVSITGAAGGAITPTSDTADQYNITALGATCSFSAPSGTPTDGQRLNIRIYSAAAQTISSWASGSGGYREIGVTLPTTSGVGKTIYVGCVYNEADAIWDVVAVATQA